MTTRPAAELDIDIDAMFAELIKSTIRFEKPPSGFNALTAPPEVLARYGLPAKPDPITQPGQFAFWQKMYSPPLEFEDEIFKKPLIGLFWPRSNHRRAALGFRSRYQTSPNWSGAYITPRDGLMFVSVHGAWQVPSPNSPPTAPSMGSHSYHSSTWIGLDGQRRYHHSSLPQIGTTQIVDLVNGVETQQAPFAWWQWWDRGGTGLAPWPLTLTINPGDLIICTVEVQPDRKSAKFIIENRTTNRSVPPFIRPAPSTPIPLYVSGATAEWVMERPSPWPSPTLYDLPKYGTVLFSDSLAVAAKAPGSLQTVERRLQGAKLINMYEVRHGPQRTARISTAKLFNERQPMTTYG